MPNSSSGFVVAATAGITLVRVAVSATTRAEWVVPNRAEISQERPRIGDPLDQIPADLDADGPVDQDVNLPATRPLREQHLPDPELPLG